MAKRQKKSDVAAAAEDAPDTAVTRPSGPTVLVLAGHDASGAALGQPSSVDSEDAPFIANLPEVHIGGVPYVHVADDVDGVWIYAPRDVRRR